jgi:hypothetical protein
MSDRFGVRLTVALACWATALMIVGCGGGGGGQPFTLAGTVTTTSGAPIAGAQVTATVLGQSQPVASTVTTSQGVFGFALPAATYVVEASASGYVTQQVTVTITDSQPNLTVEVILSAVGPPPPPPINTGGRVTNAATFAAIQGATVTATLQGQITPVETATTDANGRYGFWLATGIYVIRASASGFNPAQQTITVTQGISNLAVDFALNPS